MPVFEITSPDGKTLEITAPEGTSHDDILAYAKANYKPETIQNTPSKQEQMSDVGVGRTAFDQSMQGATFGFSDEIQNRIGALVAHAVTGEDYSSLLDEANKSSKLRLQAEMEQNPGTAIASNIAGSLLTGGAAATTKAGGAVASAVNSGGIPARILKGALAGASSGAAYGAGTADEGNRIEGALEGGALGGVLGGAAPAIIGTGSAVKNAVIPQVDDVVRDLADKAVNTYGIPLKRSQIGDSRFAKVLSSTAEKVPLSGAVTFDKNVSKAFNRAVLKTIGEDADKVTPQVIGAAYKNIGQRFDDVIKGQIITVDDTIMNRLAGIEADARSAVTGDHAKIVQNQISKFLNDIAEDGTIAGEKIGSFRSQLTKILQRTRNDASPYLKDLQDLVIDATVDGAPEKRELLNTARLQYKNLKTIEPLAEKAVRGNIQPSLLLSRVATKFGDFSRGGGGELGDLARIGQAFLKDTIPNSGTPERLAAYGVLGGGALASLPMAAKAVGIAAAFNAANTSQKLVKRAIKGGPKKLSGKRTGILTGNIAGQLTSD